MLLFGLCFTILFLLNESLSPPVQSAFASLEEEKTDGSAHKGHGNMTMGKDHSVLLKPVTNFRTGLLVIAHGGSPDWEKQVVDAMAPMKDRLPVVIAFGMAMEDTAYLQEGVNLLEEQGVEEIVILPLFVSSEAPLPRHFQSIFALIKDPPLWDVKPVKPETPYFFVNPVNGDPFVGGILRDFALSISEDPKKEAVLLIAHGPVTDEDNAFWIENLASFADVIREAGFAAVEYGTLRDDAPPNVREKAVAELREKASALKRDHRLLVVPVLISSSDIQDKIEADLNGIEFRFESRGIVSHPDFYKWVEMRLSPFLEVQQ